MKKVIKYIYSCTLLSAICQILLILVSWLMSAAIPELGLRSMLSSAGIRWFFGTFTSNLASPLLVWMILLFIAISGLVRSGLWNVIIRFFRRDSLNTQLRFALVITFVVFLLEIVTMLLLTLTRHAILLSVTGHLFPSSFSESIMPVIAFIIGSCSIVYGLLSGKFRTVYDVGSGLSGSGRILMPVLLFYVVTMQLIASLQFVF
ncbi:MAG: hypothetical protein ACOYJF_00890 [Prevotella sp.]|jgi:p-aminobenzoyl-glutamate transporter AbgT